MSADVAAITGYHAHVYYDAASKEKAARLRAKLEAAFDVRLGRWHNRPIRVTYTGSAASKRTSQPATSLMRQTTTKY